MSSIHYKFSASSTYKTVVFNGIAISLSDLKREIMEKEGLKPTEVDLSISNAQTSEQFKNESEMISKNSSVVVLRTPLSRRIGVGNNSTAYAVNMPKKASTTKHTLEQLKSISDLSRVDADEEDKIAAMMHQAGAGYDKFHSKARYNNSKPAPAYLRCYKCQGQGHYPSSCPQRGPVEKKALPPTGIPRSKLRPAMASDKGAKLCSDGTYMVVASDVTAYQNPKKERPPFVPVEKKEESDEEVIPDELSCDLCHELVREPVKTPCCYSSYCRDCISKELLAQDEQLCLKCKKPLTPYQLIEDKSLKQDAINFKNATAYSRKSAKANAGAGLSAAKKVTYGGNNEYGQVLGSNGKLEMNKNAYIVKSESNVIIKDEPITGSLAPPTIAPPSLPPPGSVGLSVPGMPPPGMPTNIPPPSLPSIPPPNLPPPVPPQMPSTVLPPTGAPPPMPPSSVAPPTSTANVPPSGPPPMMPPGMPPFPGFPGMPPGMPGFPGMPPTQGMHSMPPGMPPMPFWPGMPGMFAPPPVNQPPKRKSRSRSRSPDNRRRNNRDRRRRSRDRRSRSRDRDRSRNRRSRSRNRSKSRGDRNRSKSRDRSTNQTRDRSRSRDRRSKSRDRSRSRSRSRTRAHSRNKDDNNRNAKSKSRSKSADKDRSPDRRSRKKRSDRTRSRSRSRDRRRHSSDDDSKSRSKKEKKKKYNKDDEGKNNKKSIRKGRDQRGRRDSAGDDDDRRTKRKRDDDESKEDSKVSQ